MTTDRRLAPGAVLPAGRDRLTLAAADGTRLAATLARPVRGGPAHTLACLGPVHAVVQAAAARLPALADTAVLTVTAREHEPEWVLDAAAVLDALEVEGLPGVLLVGVGPAAAGVLACADDPAVVGVVLLDPDPEPDGWPVLRCAGPGDVERCLDELAGMLGLGPLPRHWPPRPGD